MWTKNYAPKTLQEVYGQEKAVEQLKEFVEKKKKAVLLYGPTGCGKTCSVYALANELSYEVIEINSSEARNKEKISSLLNSSIKQSSLFGKSKIILIDEIDTISGTEDRGAVNVITDIIDKSQFPIVMTANDITEKKIAPIVKKCVKIEFEPLHHSLIKQILEKICKIEEIKQDEECLIQLARTSGGDVRAAINDLQVATKGKKELKKEDIECLGNREVEEDIMESLRVIFKSKKVENVLGLFENSDYDLNEVMMWIDENVPKEYTNQSLTKAYESMSRADVFNGRIKRWQHWRFLTYINALLTAGVALAKDEKKQGYIEYKRSERILKMWIAKMQNMKKVSIAEKASEKLHISANSSFKSFVPYLRFILKGKDGQAIAEELRLSEEEISRLS